MTVSGELNKPGTTSASVMGSMPASDRRSDTDYSLILGEALAISVLQDRAQCYNEKFTVSSPKLMEPRQAFPTNSAKAPF